MWFQDFLAFGFLVGLTLIYCPQYYKIIQMQSSIGFSPWFLFLGCTASFLAWVNASIYYLDNWKNCHGGWDCTQHLFGFSILWFQWFLFLLSYILFVAYFSEPDESFALIFKDVDKPVDISANRSADRSPPKEIYTNDIKTRCGHIFKKLVKNVAHTRTKKSVIVQFIISQLIGLFSFIITVCLLRKGHWNGEHRHSIKIWSTFLEILTMIMFCIHYFPQIYETVALKSVGSFSLITLGIMCPGTFVWTYFLAKQSSIAQTTGGGGNGSNTSDPAIWLPFLATAILQLILLIIGVYYEIRNSRNKTLKNTPLDTSEEEQLLS